MKLTQEQIEVISQFISTSNLKSRELEEEFFDHLCSVSEENYKPTISFQEFIEAQANLFAPNGLKHLEIQTLIANQTHSEIMTKKIVYTFGLLASLALTTGVLFKLMSWPGANVLLLSGITALLLGFVPYLAIGKLNSGALNRTTDKARVLLGLIASVLIGVSVIFKALHLTGANVIFVIGMGLFIFGFLPLLFLWFYKRETYSFEGAR